jgi:hypothetical protein
MKTPPDIKVHRHSSETARSKNDAGGEVPTSDYARPLPRRQGGQADDRD